MPDANFSHEEIMQAILFDVALSLRVLVKANHAGRPLSQDEIIKTGSELKDAIVGFINIGREQMTKSHS